MPRWSDKWIVVVNWDKFQSRRERPEAPWIKNYRRLLHKSEYVDLGLADRGLLHFVWLAYAEEDGRLRTADVLRFLLPVDLPPKRRRVDHQRISRGLVRLNRAGFIGFCDDKPLPLSSSLTTRARENKKNAVCGFCEMGGGFHTTDCPTLEDSQLMVRHLLGAA